MTPSALAVANRFIALAKADHGRRLTPLQLMKLVYIAHGWNLGLNHRPLFREKVEAWTYGPVIPELYQAIKKFGGDPIECDALQGAEDCGSLTPEDDEIIRQTYDIYGMRSGLSLSALTHQPDTPWDVTMRALGQNAEITGDLIEEHYVGLARGNAHAG